MLCIQYSEWMLSDMPRACACITATYDRLGLDSFSAGLEAMSVTANAAT
jgi:hypothetical protein